MQRSDRPVLAVMTPSWGLQLLRGGARVNAAGAPVSKARGLWKDQRVPSTAAPTRATTAFVLAGGGARGAYEVGVLQYLEEELAHELGRPLKPQIVCGTSIGALHACHLAAHADRLEHVRFLSDQWRSLRIRDVVDFRWWDVLRLVRESFGRREWTGSAFARAGSVASSSAPR